MQATKSMLLFLAAAWVMAAADSPFIGKWKLNAGKSQFAGTTNTIEKLPSGEYQSTADGQSYKFKLDGKEYPTPISGTAAWKQVDANTFETVYKGPGMVTTTTTKISADGKTMTEVSKGKKPNGESFDSSTTSQRVSGSSGLEGKWKSTDVKPTTEMWDIKANGPDGLIITIVDYNVVVAMKFDGKDYTPTGPTVPKDFTLSFKKTGERSFDMIEKSAGKPVFLDSFVVSADGKVITETSNAPGSSEKVKSVYDKQ